jgi:nicotinamide-nucleotide adenylyltransferase
VRGLLIGRFQPFHLGHLAVVQEIRHRHPKEPLLLGIGRAQASYSRENPFTAGERFEMIERALGEAGIVGCTPVPLVDVDRHAIWVAHVTSLLPAFRRVYTNNPLTRRLFEAAGFEVEGTPMYDRPRFEGTRIRALLAIGGPWKELVPGAVATYLEELRAPERLRDLEGEPTVGRPGAGR